MRGLLRGTWISPEVLAESALAYVLRMSEAFPPKRFPRIALSTSEGVRPCVRACMAGKFKCMCRSGSVAVSVEVPVSG